VKHTDLKYVPVSPNRESVAFMLNPSPAIFCNPRRYSQTWNYTTKRHIKWKNLHCICNRVWDFI